MGEGLTRIELEADEAIVLQVASRIYAAYIASGQCTVDNEVAMRQKARDEAVLLTQEVDERVSAGDEVKAGLQNDPNYRPLG